MSINVWGQKMGLTIEEAVVNAVYHRYYTVREPIEIRIYQDEMLILSYPGPDRSVKLEALQKGNTYFQVKLPVHGEVLKEHDEELDLTPMLPLMLPPMLKNYYLC